VNPCIYDPTGDTLDAVLAAVQAAWASTQPDYGIPSGVDPREGWIVDPGLLDVPAETIRAAYETTLRPGLQGEVAVDVTDDLTAAALGSGNVHVYSTPALIALLEAAAVQALDGHLPEGKTSVGTRLNVRHLAATPVGMSVQATATLKEVDGRRLMFEVNASDEVEPIGSGTHERFIVDRERFEQRVRDKQVK
jgi:predicted thioesterase